MIPLRNLKRFFGKAVAQPLYAFRVGTQRLKAYFSYAFLKGASPAPEAITFFLTRACNLRCRMCGQWGDYGITRQESPQGLKHWLSLEEIRGVIDGMRRDHPAITLFGGEPFLHPNILEIIGSVKKAGLHCLVITNGTLIEPFAEEIVAQRLDELNISIDGGPARHDEIRGVPGVFDRIMTGIDKVNFYKHEANASKPLINLQCTISRYNYEHLEELLEVARRARASSLTFHNLIFLRDELIRKQAVFDEKLGCSSRDWQGFVFEPGIDPARLYEQLESVRENARDIVVDFYPNFSQKGLAE